METKALIAQCLNEGFNSLQSEVNHTVKVAILDSGIQKSHPDLHDYVKKAFKPSKQNDELIISEVKPGNEDKYGHGTAVAGVLLSHATNVELYDYQVFSDYTGMSDVLYASLEHAINQDVDIINLSLSVKKELTARLYPLIDEATHKNILVVSSARNAPLDYFGYPAECAGSLSVGIDCTVDYPEITYEKNHPIEFYANGKIDDALTPDGGTVEVRGTSFSTPVVTAMTAILKGINPSLTCFEIKAILKSIAKKKLDRLAKG